MGQSGQGWACWCKGLEEGVNGMEGACTRRAPRPPHAAARSRQVAVQLGVVRVPLQVLPVDQVLHALLDRARVGAERARELGHDLKHQLLVGQDLGGAWGRRVEQT